LNETLDVHVDGALRSRSREESSDVPDANHQPASSGRAARVTLEVVVV